MKKLSSQELKRMVSGSSWFGTGGGFPLKKQLEAIAHMSGVLCSVEEMNPDDMVCCAYGLGSAANTGVSLRDSFLDAVSILEDRARLKCKAIFPAEINIESAIFEVATSLNLPVLDADTCGGRAVPELQYDNFTILKRSIAPIVAVNTEHRSLVIESYTDVNEVEAGLREFAVASPGGCIAVVDHPIRVSEAAQSLTLGTLSRSLRVGEAIGCYQAGTIAFDQLLLEAGAKVLVEDGKIIESGLSDRAGFFQGELKIVAQDGCFEVEVKNEFMRLRRGQEIIAGFPELIVLVFPDTMLGAHSTECATGIKIMLLAIEASGLWR